MKKAPLFALVLTVFIDLLGFGIIVPFLAFFAQHYGASGRTVGAILAVYSLMQFFFAPLWGRLSDRIGRRPVLLISLSGSVIGYMLLAFSHSLAMLFIARMIAGIAAANIGTAQAYIADVTSPEDRARGMGLLGAAFGVGFVLGPPLGGVLAKLGSSFGLSQNFFPGVVAATLSMIAFGVAYFTLVESRTPGLPTRSALPPHLDSAMWKRVFATPALPLIFGSLFLTILAFAAMDPLVTLHAAERFRFGPSDLGWFYLFIGAIVAAIQGGLIGKLTRRFGESLVAIVGAAAFLVGMLLIPPTQRVPVLYLISVLYATGQGLCYPALTSLLTRVVPREQTGSMLGISSSLGSLARVIGPLFAGFFYDHFGARGGFYATAAVVGVALLLNIALRSQQQEAALLDVKPQAAP